MEQFPNDALDAHDLPRRVVAAILLEHRGNEHPRSARHPQAYARSSRAALEDRRLPASAHDQEARQGDGPQPARIQGRHRQSRRQRRGADGRDRLGPAERRRAGLDGRRNLSGGARHPHVRRALGSRPRWSSRNRSSAARRRAARRSPTRTSTTSPDYAADPEGRAGAAHRPHPPRQSAHARD